MKEGYAVTRIQHTSHLQARNKTAYVILRCVIHKHKTKLEKIHF